MDYWCCLMGICCAFASAEQFEKLVAMRLKSKACASRAAAENVVKDDLRMAKAFRELMQAA